MSRSSDALHVGRSDVQRLYERDLDFPRSGRPDRRDGVVITSLYRLYDEHGDLLYIGITNSLVARVRAHRLKPWGWQIRTVEWTEFIDREIALNEEACAIYTERPFFNVQHMQPESL